MDVTLLIAWFAAPCGPPHCGVGADPSAGQPRAFPRKEPNGSGTEFWILRNFSLEIHRSCSICDTRDSSHRMPMDPVSCFCFARVDPRMKKGNIIQGCVDQCSKNGLQGCLGRRSIITFTESDGEYLYRFPPMLLTLSPGVLRLKPRPSV